jgi:drug/metabolite transporter (DMT)-like permease
VPFAFLVSLFFSSDFRITPHGLALGVASGAVASGCGYVIWYAALAGLTGTRAATVQLTVPVIAAFGGIVLLSEQLTIRLVIASAMTLGGVAIVMAQRAAKASAS